MRLLYTPKKKKCFKTEEEIKIFNDKRSNSWSLHMITAEIIQGVLHTAEEINAYRHMSWWEKKSHEKSRWMTQETNL